MFGVSINSFYVGFSVFSDRSSTSIILIGKKSICWMLIRKTSLDDSELNLLINVKIILTNFYIHLFMYIKYLFFVSIYF